MVGARRGRRLGDSDEGVGDNVSSQLTGWCVGCEEGCAEEMPVGAKAGRDGVVMGGMRVTMVVNRLQVGGVRWGGGGEGNGLGGMNANDGRGEAFGVVAGAWFVSGVGPAFVSANCVLA